MSKLWPNLSDSLLGFRVLSESLRFVTPERCFCLMRCVE